MKRPIALAVVLAAMVAGISAGCATSGSPRIPPKGIEGPNIR